MSRKKDLLAYIKSLIEEEQNQESFEGYEQTKSHLHSRAQVSYPGLSYPGLVYPSRDYPSLSSSTLSYPGREYPEIEYPGTFGLAYPNPMAGRDYPSLAYPITDLDRSYPDFLYPGGIGDESWRNPYEGSDPDADQDNK